MTELNIHNIRPYGRFQQILEKVRSKVDEMIDKTLEEDKYNSRLSAMIKMIVDDFGFIWIFEEVLLKKDGWDLDEALIDLLYVHLMIIDLNQVAHKFLNPQVVFPSRINQLREMIANKPKVYGKLIIIEAEINIDLNIDLN